MSQVLYRKYRPQIFADLVGQDTISNTLQKALTTGRISHAYLFSGPKGTGKTTTARILTKALNCLQKEVTPKTKKRENESSITFPSEPCGLCDACKAIQEGTFLDLYEIDAASNRGIDEMRDLKEKVNYPPATGRFKVYIVDEVHMLTTEAANALLKTLEEPPAHAIFILCTTEKHKLLPTVISRCQSYDFQRASLKDIVTRLQQILEKEDVKIEEKALMQIAQNASGGFRDAEALLSKLLSLTQKNTITEELIEQTLGLIDTSTVWDLIKYIYENETQKALILIDKVNETGINLNDLIKKMIEYLRIMMLIRAGVGAELIELSSEEFETYVQVSKNWDEKIIAQLLVSLQESQKEMKTTVVQTLPLEMVVIKQNMLSKTPATVTFPVMKEKIQKAVPQKIVVKDQEVKEEIVTVRSQPKVSSVASGVKNDELLSEIVLKWQEVLKNVRPRNHSIEAFLKACQPVSVFGNTLHLEFFYPFHKERIEDSKARIIVEEVLSATMSQDLTIKCLLGEKKSNSVKKVVSIDANKQEDLLEAAEDIFKGELIS